MPSQRAHEPARANELFVVLKATLSSAAARRYGGGAGLVAPRCLVACQIAGVCPGFVSGAAALGVRPEGGGMSQASARFAAHVRRLWPRWALLPAAPFWLLVAFWAVQGKLRWDHVALALLATVLAYGSAW